MILPVVSLFLNRKVELIVQFNFTNSLKNLSSPIHIALVGNPNSGKSSIFNSLTGLNQKIGNFPGVTVDKKKGISIIS